MAFSKSKKAYSGDGKNGKKAEGGEWRLAGALLLLPGDAQTSEVGQQPHMLPV